MKFPARTVAVFCSAIGLLAAAAPARARGCRNTTLRFIRRTRALLVVVIAAAVLTTLLPLTTGPAHAATMLPANESVLALRADQVNRDSVPGTPLCKAPVRTVPGTDQTALPRAIEAAREAGVVVPTEERADDGTTMVSYIISGSRDAASPRQQADAWWIYETWQAAPCHNDSNLYTDFSGILNNEMVKAAAKHATRISAFLGALSGILSPFLSHGQILVILGIVSGVLALAGMTLLKFYKTIKKYTVGNGKHTGWYANVEETLFGDAYHSDAVRSCVAGWWVPKCGSGGRLVAGNRE